MDTWLNEMKILPSSPYAVFNAKEWDSLLNSRKKFNKNNKFNLHSYYYKNSYNRQSANFFRKENNTIQRAP